MQKETISHAIAAYFQALSSLNAEDWVALFAEDGITYDPVGNPPSQVRETYQQFFGILSMAFASLDVSPDQIFISGNGAAVKWTMRGVGTNDRRGVAEGISTFEFDEMGKIKTVFSYWDDAAMMAQIRG